MITVIDPYVISQYVINFAHGMQEENVNELVASWFTVDELAMYDNFLIFQFHENSCDLQTLCSLW